MPHYRSVGDVPPKRHLRVARPRRHPAVRGADGGGGVLRASPRCSTTCGRRRPSSRPRPVATSAATLVANDPLLPRHLRTPRLPPGGDAVTGRHVLLGNDDVHHLRGWRPTAPARSTATPSATSWPTCRRARACSSRCSARWPRAAGDYVVVPRSATHRWVVPDGGRLELLLLEAPRPRPPARAATCRPAGQFLEQAPYCERDIRGPDGPLTCDPTRGRSTCWSATATGLTRHTPRRHAVRRGGLGRLPVPVGPVHPRLRAHRGRHPPAAPRPPDLRGPRLRGVLVRAPPLRLPRRRHQGARTTTPTWTATRCSSTRRATS